MMENGEEGRGREEREGGGGKFVPLPYKRL